MHYPVKALVAWLVVCVVWGTTYLAIRIGVASVEPFFFAAVRFLTAGFMLFCANMVLKHRLPRRKEYLYLSVTGIVLLTGTNGMVSYALQWIPSGITAVIISMVPIWMNLIAAAIPGGEKLTAKTLFGLFLSLAGIVLLFYPELTVTHVNVDILFGGSIVLIASVLWAGGSIYAKTFHVQTHPMMSAAIQMIAGGMGLMILSTVLGTYGDSQWTIASSLALCYLILFGSILGYGSYLYALQNLSASVVSTYAYINPVIAVIVGAVIAKEVLDLRISIAIIIILSGVVIVNRAIFPQWRRAPGGASAIRLEEKDEKEYIWRQKD